MKKVLIVFGVIVVILVIWLFSLPGEYSIQRTVKIDASKSVVYRNVADFTRWPQWSPWIVMDRGAPIKYTGQPATVGSKYDWDSELLGAGEMEILTMDDQENQLDCALRFTKPYKSESDVYFHLKGDDSSTEILWGMRGKLPFFLRFMTKSMETYIGMDYERGLSMLKDLCEDSVVFSQITYGEVKTNKPIHFIGIKHTLKMEEMGDIMQDDFTALNQLFEEKGWDMSGFPMSVYYHIDFESGMTEFATAFPSIQNVNDLPANFFQSEIPETKALQVIHHGKYEHIGNAWSAAIQYARTYKLKANMKAVSWEVYTNNPNEVESPKDYETIVYLPLK